MNRVYVNFQTMRLLGLSRPWLEVTGEQYDALRAAAKAAGRTLCQHLRDKALAQTRTQG